jgi:hypothetical protein
MDEEGGAQDVPDSGVVFGEAILLARNMEMDVKDFYNGCAHSINACRRWHYKTADGTLLARSVTIIQKDIWTTPRLYSSSPVFLWVYNHCILKAGNEAVVEGMCKFIARQANSERGLSMGRYAKDARIAWHAPLQHEADPFLMEALNHYFGKEGRWHFYSTDKTNRPLLVIYISKVIDKLKTRLSRFTFMKVKEGYS